MKKRVSACEDREGGGPARRDLVIVITGNGKGKTTASLGQALRAIGHGYRVCMIQFMKGRIYGELLAAEKYLPPLKIHRCGSDSFVMRGNHALVDVEMAAKGMALARAMIDSGDYDMVILDEINVAMDFSLVPVADVISLIRNRPAGVDLILTGRCAPAEIMEIADTVSEVREVKHHYQAGIKDREGIEH